MLCSASRIAARGCQYVDSTDNDEPVSALLRKPANLLEFGIRTVAADFKVDPVGRGDASGLMRGAWVNS